MKNKAVYIEKFNAYLKELQADLDKLEDKVRKSEVDLKIKYKDDIENLKKKKAGLQAKLDEIRSSSGEAWNELKEGTDKAFDDLKKSWSAAWQKFK
jgi:DNA repair ATPase RecN